MTFQYVIKRRGAVWHFTIFGVRRGWLGLECRRRVSNQLADPRTSLSSDSEAWIASNQFKTAKALECADIDFNLCLTKDKDWEGSMLKLRYVNVIIHAELAGLKCSYEVHQKE